MSILKYLSRFGRNSAKLADESVHLRSLDTILPRIARAGVQQLDNREKVTIARAFDELRTALSKDGTTDLRVQRSTFLNMVSDQIPSPEARREFLTHWADGKRIIDGNPRIPNPSSPAARATHAAREAAQIPVVRFNDSELASVTRSLKDFKGNNLNSIKSLDEFDAAWKKFDDILEDKGVIASSRERLGRSELRTGQDVANALRDGKKVTQKEVDLLRDMHRERLNVHLEADSTKTYQPPQQPGMMGGGSRAESPATKKALEVHEADRSFAIGRLGAFSEANKLFEAGSSQLLVQKFSQLDGMVGAFSIKQMGNLGDAKLDALGNLENSADVLFSSMIPVGVKPKGEAIGLIPTSKADPLDVNGKILSYFDNEGNPLQPLISADHPSPDDVNMVLQQLLSYKPGVEVHVHPADWQKIRGVVYEARFNELSSKISGGRGLDASAGTGAAGKDSMLSELDDYIESLRITGKVVPDSTGVSGHNINDIVANSRGPNGKISESDVEAIRQRYTTARGAENNPASNDVRDIVDNLKPQTKEVADVQTEMANLRKNVRDASMLDTTPIDASAPLRNIDEISDALRNGEQVKAPELKDYISKQLGDSLESSQNSLVAALQSGFNANKRMDTEQIFTQLERIRKDPDYPLRNAEVDAKSRTATPKDINQRLFNGQAISDGELTVLRSFYKRFFDAGSASAETGGGGAGIKALQLAQSITEGIKDSKSVSAGSISRITQYNTGVTIPSVRRTVIAAMPLAVAGAVGQAALNPEDPNFFGRAAINYVYPDGNNNTADDFAEFTFNRMNANTKMAREYFKQYLGIDLPQNVSEGQAKALEDKNFYTDAIQRLRTNQFIKEPTPDLRQALMMYASIKATGVASASSAEVQTELAKNVQSETGKIEADIGRAEADAAMQNPTATNFSLSGPKAQTSDQSLSTTFKDATQFESYLTKNNALFGLNNTQLSGVMKAWQEVARDGKLESMDQPALETRLGRVGGLDQQQIQMLTQAALSPAAM